MTPRISRNLPNAYAALAGAALLLVAAAGCAGEDTPADTAEDAASEAPDPSKQEVDEPQPRLVVTTDSGAVVLDAASGETLAEVDTQVRPTPSVAGDGRHVFLVQADADLTQVLDAGSWTSAHGDHTHSYIADPKLRDSVVEGAHPVHVVSHDGHTAIFHDDDGTASVFADNGLLIDTLDTTTVDSGEPHHGVVAPLEDGALVSIPSPAGPDALPVGVAVVDSAGEETARFETCPELHGEASLHDASVFACENGMLVVEGAESSTIPYPSDAGRIGSFLTGPAGEVLVGNYTDTSLLAVDVEAGTAHEIPVGLPYAARALGPHGEAVVLTTDGALHVIDPVPGQVMGTVAGVVAPFEIPEDWQVARPSLAVAGHTAFVADPASSAVVPVDLETWTVGHPVTLEEAPAGIVAVGAAPHDH